MVISLQNFFLPFQWFFHSGQKWVGDSAKLDGFLPNLVSGVARFCCEEGQGCKLCHGALTVDSRAGCNSCSMTNGFVTNAVLIEIYVSC